MKLSKAQLATLESVERGEVRKVYSFYISRPARLDGARKRTLEILIERGLVFLDWQPKKVVKLDDYYRLTDAGEKALEEARK